MIFGLIFVANGCGTESEFADGKCCEHERREWEKVPHVVLSAQSSGHHHERSREGLAPVSAFACLSLNTEIPLMSLKANALLDANGHIMAPIPT